MKKAFKITGTVSLAIVLGISILFFTSCAGLQFTGNQEFAVTKLSRIAGITLGLEKPEEIDQALSYIDYLSGIEDANLKEAALNAAVAYIYRKYGKTNKTVIIVAEVVDLVNVVVPNNAAGDIGNTIDMKLLNLALDGFRQGLILAQ